MNRIARMNYDAISEFALSRSRRTSPRRANVEESSTTPCQPADGFQCRSTIT